MRIVVVGWGAIAQRIYEALPEGAVLAGIAMRVESQKPTPPKIARLTSVAELGALMPDLVIEAAGRTAVLPWGLAAFAKGADFAPLSVSAFADVDVLEALLVAARKARRQLIVAPGAIGGMDALAALQGVEQVEHQITKPPQAWVGTRAENFCELSKVLCATTFWEGTAREAAQFFPKNVNSTVAISLAGIGLDATRVRLTADPLQRENSHHIMARGSFGEIDIKLRNRVLQGNPKSSEITAMSMLRVIRNRMSALVI